MGLLSSLFSVQEPLPHAPPLVLPPFSSLPQTPSQLLTWEGLESRHCRLSLSLVTAGPAPPFPECCPGSDSGPAQHSGGGNPAQSRRSTEHGGWGERG